MCVIDLGILTFYDIKVYSITNCQWVFDIGLCIHGKTLTLHLHFNKRSKEGKYWFLTSISDQIRCNVSIAMPSLYILWKKYISQRIAIHFYLNIIIIQTIKKSIFKLSKLCNQFVENLKWPNINFITFHPNYKSHFWNCYKMQSMLLQMHHFK